MRLRDGACVIVYEGKRGTVFRIKYRDASGRQVKETLGRTADGWTHQKARAELDARLTDVRRDGWRRPERVSFAEVAEQWLTTYPESKGLKQSTRDDYAAIVNGHLIPAFASLPFASVDVETIERYMADKREEGIGGARINRHLNVLHAIFKMAMRRKLTRENPVKEIDRPKETPREWAILSPVEISAVASVFVQLANDATTDEERSWIEQSRVVFVTVLATGLRRGEILGLRWRDVDLADPEGARLRVRETLVHGRVDTPKSRKAERTLALGQRLAEELWQHRRRSRYAGADDRVFCHPQKGSPLDHKRYAVTLRRALTRAEITKPVRPFHDGRHSSITNAAVAGLTPAALMARAGHANFSTTQRYINLTGELFRDEAARLEERLFGVQYQNQYQEAAAAADPSAEAAA